jgi:hypothetical protein
VNSIHPFRIQSQFATLDDDVPPDNNNNDALGFLAPNVSEAAMQEGVATVVRQEAVTESLRWCKTIVRLTSSPVALLGGVLTDGNGEVDGMDAKFGHRYAFCDYRFTCRRPKK